MLTSYCCHPGESAVDKTNRLLRCLLLAVVAYLSQVQFAGADDTGIDKARLIEQSGGEYILEVDTLPRLAGAYRKPIFPSRFEMVGNVERERQPGYLAMRYRFDTDGPLLAADDTILLPWGRAGVSLTVQWSDGKLQQGLFLRNVSGIPIDIKYFRSDDNSERLSWQFNFISTLKSAFGSWLHWLLILSCFLFAGNRQTFVLLGWFAVGNAVCLILCDLGVPQVPALVVELCLLVAVTLMIRDSIVGHDDASRYSLILFVLGVLTGLSFLASLESLDPQRDRLLPALFGYLLGVNAFHFVIAVILVLVAASIFNSHPIRAPRQILQLAIGSCAIAGIIFVSTGFQNPARSVSVKKRAQILESPAGGMAMIKKLDNRQLRLDQATKPINGYLTIEPMEVRLELLVRLETALKSTLAGSTLPDMIPVNQQTEVLEKVRQHFRDRLKIKIDDRETVAIFEQAGFVQVLANGIVNREQAVPEQADSAMLGLTFAFATEKLADRIELQWFEFRDHLNELPCAIVDPFGTSQQQLTVDNPVLKWENKLSGFNPPQVRPIPVKQMSIPLASLVLLALGSLVWWLTRQREGVLSSVITGLLIGSAVVLYPFARYAPTVSVANTWQIGSNEASSILKELLSNAYRAFEIRDEAASYDRLEQCVVGDQLRDFYLQSRKSLEMEERGGARARIDKVEILDVFSVDGNSSGELAIECKWLASGYVNHFGHTHYRNNVYRAQVVIAPVDGYWKFKSFRIVDIFIFL